MREAELLEAIRTDKGIAQALVEFDFDPARVAHGPAEEIHLAGGEPMEMIAGDASGGAFLLVGKEGDGDRPVVYAGSEGEGGLIAKNLHEALALVVGLSSIHDAMAFPADEDGGATLRTWLAKCDTELREDWPDLDADRARLRETLGLPDALELLGALHAAQADETYRPINSEEGNPYESMLSE